MVFHFYLLYVPSLIQDNALNYDLSVVLIRRTVKDFFVLFMMIKHCTLVSVYIYKHWERQTICSVDLQFQWSLVVAAYACASSGSRD